jgi:2'-5' RNA ligase
MQATEVSLMKSDLQRSGAVYTQLFAARLPG